MNGSSSRRVWPGRDEKLLTDWTSLAVSAFALAGRVLSEPRYEAAARAAADRILRNCRRDGVLFHREKDGAAGIAGFASDFANSIEALLDLYEATFEPDYFRVAVDLRRISTPDSSIPPAAIPWPPKTTTGSSSGRGRSTTARPRLPTRSRP
jgi:uncharacterized protein YyaL (SSP411 family)